MTSAFVKFPVSLAMDPRLTAGARACYAVLVRLAYLEGRRREEDVVAAPPRSRVADVLRCSENTVRSYLGELAASGWIVERRGTSRRAREIQVFERSIHSLPQPVGKSVNNSKSERPRAASPLISLEEELAIASSLDCAVPSLVKVAGRNLAYDVLQRECGIAEKSPRVREIPPALNGSRTTGPGIREQYWREVVDRALSQGMAASEVVERASGNAEGFERAFAGAVEERCAMYRIAMSGAALTPGALQKWWSDLPLMVDAPRGDLLSRMRAKEQQLREEGQ